MTQILYFIPLIFLFLGSFHKTAPRKTKILFFCIMLFVCGGYMTGSDWPGYESEYYENFTHRLVEPGYMAFSNFFSNLGVNFWVFCVLSKCFCFVLSFKFINRLCDTSENFYFASLWWYASSALYLYIDCPFRNTVSCGIAITAFYILIKEDKHLSDYILYFVISLVAISFHYSAVILLILPFFKVSKIPSRILVYVYFIIMIVLSIGKSSFIFNVFANYLPADLFDRIDYYSDTNVGSIISFGSIPRLICLYLIIKFRDRLVSGTRYGGFIFNMSYLYLIVSLVYYMVPMLFRSALFLTPFYVAAFGICVHQIHIKNRQTIKYALFAIVFAITLSYTSSKYYVPYTNIFYHAVTGNTYDISYRENYNLQNSPYKNK